MRVVLLCATRRGYLFLKKLKSLLPDWSLTTFSFREEPWEPPFLDEIRELTLFLNGQFFEASQVGATRWHDFWHSTSVDLLFTVNWRYMIPTSVYSHARLGSFTFHDSLLPRYRGFSPTVWAMIQGETDTGVTLFRTAEDMDTGNIIDQVSVPIGPEEAISDVMNHVTEAYLTLLEKNIQNLVKGAAPERTQDHSMATYTCKRLPEDNLIDWNAPTEVIHNLVRAVSAPYPGAYTYLEYRKLWIWSARPVRDPRIYVGRIPGRVVEVRKGEGADVLTGDGILTLRTVQLEGNEIVCASEILHRIGQTLESD